MAITVSFEVDYEFDQIEVTCPGLLAEGTATLVHDNDGEFYVKCFTLKKGQTFHRGGSGNGSEYTRRRFEEVAKSIEADKHAAKFFAEELEAYCSSLSVAAE